jgi:hypothetical protein
VSEAFKWQDVCYGEERFLADTETFVGRSAPQSGDIAILALRVGGGSAGKEGRA